MGLLNYCYYCLSNSCRHSANADVIANVKSKIIVSRQHFFADMIYAATSKIQNYQYKTGEKSLYPSKYVHNKYFKEFQRYEKVQSSLLIIAVCHVSLIFLESIWSYNHLASIPRHCSVSHRNSMPKMWISGNAFNVFWAYEPLPVVKLKYLRRIYFHEKIFPMNLLFWIVSWKLQIENCKFHRTFYVNINQKFNFTEDIFTI